MPKKNNSGTGTEKGTDNNIVDIVTKKRGAKWTQELSENAPSPPGENARYVRLAMASLNLPPIDISDPQQVQNRIVEYLNHCVDNDRRPQIVGMCNWLGISRDTLNSWVRGECRESTHSDIIKKAYAVMEEMWADYMANGKISPPTAIFLAKNWYNYKDVADVVVTPNNPFSGVSADEAKQRILESVPDEEE